jgi:hypothetical protein
MLGLQDASLGVDLLWEFCMNKRIKKLVKQATRPRGPNKPAELDTDYLAELIVQECAAIAKDCYIYHEPLSKVPAHIMKFERLNDDNMGHKL